jgi:hypothetical protein
MTIPSVRKRPIAVVMHRVMHVAMRVMARVMARVVMRVVMTAVVSTVMAATVTATEVESQDRLCLITEHGRDGHGQKQKLTHDEISSVEDERAKKRTLHARRLPARAAK